MSTVAATAERPDGQEQPVRPAAGCRIRRRWLPPAIVGGLLALLLTGGLVVTTPPAFYRRVVGLGSDAEALAGRFVTEAAAVVAAVDREGPWGVEMSQHALNAWLGLDLPRNHPELLGRSAWGRLARPRVEFAPKLARIGIEVTAWGVTAVAWAEVEVSLRAANQFVLTVRRAGLGSLPLPRDAVLRECGKRLAEAGLLDSTQVLFGSGMSDGSIHSNRNLPVLLAGGGLKHQGHIVCPAEQHQRVPLSNLWLSVLHWFGSERERFGRSTGTFSPMEIG